MDPDQEQSDLGPYCLPVCKNRFEKFARIFSRRHKQTTFSNAGFLGALRVNLNQEIENLNLKLSVYVCVCMRTCALAHAPAEGIQLFQTLLV